MSTRQIISQHATVQVEKDTRSGQHALHARQSFHPGNVISPFQAGSVHREPSYLTVQTGEHEHITLQPVFLQYCNHSCEPNCFFDCDAMEFVCIAPIAAGDELTFFYPSSEWHMAQPFPCHCGSEKCLGIISGADVIAEDILKTYRLTGFIQSKLKERKKKNSFK